MDSGDIVWRIAQLASLPFQERYFIGGTTNECVLSSELLENVDAIQYKVGRGNEANLTDAQRLALQDLFVYIDQHSGEALGAKSRNAEAILIRESSVW